MPVKSVKLALVGKMEFSELEGDRSGSKIYATSDGHLYRRNRSSAAPRYLVCYFGIITKKMRKLNPKARLCAGI